MMFFYQISKKNYFYMTNILSYLQNYIKNNLLPNKILLTGQSGLGKSTFAYHFINFILSDKEDCPYDFHELHY